MNFAASGGAMIRRHEYHLIVLVFLISHFICPTVQYRGCGPHLANAVELVCEMRPGVNNEDPEDQTDDATQLVSLLTEQSRNKKSSPFVSKRTANGFLRVRSRRGIVDECCNRDCHIEELEEYCPPVVGKIPRGIEDEQQQVTAKEEEPMVEESATINGNEASLRDQETNGNVIPETETDRVVASNMALDINANEAPSADPVQNEISETYLGVGLIPTAEPVQKETLSVEEELKETALGQARQNIDPTVKSVLPQQIMKNVKQVAPYIGQYKPDAHAGSAAPSDATQAYKIQTVRVPPIPKVGSSRRPFPHKVLESINRWRG
ncbi:uncharacterized protein LOC135487942 [Lineus longissimus]|uniref:uncharacterized protein LOC135487942 n=1 Tax=Lineus longissimus TaxID=88925 RepID=UPI002B4EA018